jgi:uncharacterized membrane protein
MLYVVFILIGLFLGIGSHNEMGVLMGGTLGFILAWMVSINTTINGLKAKISFLQNRSSNSNNLSPEKADKPVVETLPKAATVVSSNNSETDKANTIADVVTEKVSAKQEKHLQTNHSSRVENSYFEVTKSVIENNNVESKADFIGIAIHKAKDLVFAYFTGGNSLVRTGMLVLFVGIAFLLKYVAQRTTFPVEYRYYGIILACIVMLVLGWRLPAKRRNYALSLQGGAIGLLYLTLFAAMRIHNLLPAPTVMMLLVVIVGITAILAVIQDSLAFAVIGLIGGFAAPILTSTGSGSHVQLFSYYLLLNFGVFFIAWFKSWRILNVVGFVATFGIGTAWGFQYYQPQFFNTVEPFLIAYFLLYTIIAVLFALKQQPKLRGINDSTLVFGSPLVAFSLQAALLKGSEYGLSYSAIALSSFYLLMVFIVKFMQKAYLKNLIESFIALSIGFATLAIPLAFDGRVTSALWAAEAAAMAWIGIRQNRILPRFSGYLLALLGSGAYFYEANTSPAQLPWINADYIGIAIITLATAFIAYFARLNKAKLFSVETVLIANTLIVISLFFWLFGGIREINDFYRSLRFVLAEAFYAGTVVALLYFTVKLRYPLLRILSVLVAVLMLFALIYMPDRYMHLTMLINQRTIGLLFITFSFYLLAWFYQHGVELKRAIDKVMPISLLLIGIFLWVLTGVIEINNAFPTRYENNFFIVFLLISFLLQIVLAHRIHWKYLQFGKYLTLPVTLFMGIISLNLHGNFHLYYGWLVWIMAFVINYWLLKKYKDRWLINIDAYHLVSLLFFSFVVVFEGGKLISYLFGNDSIWYHSAFVLILLLICSALYLFRNSKAYPLATHHRAYYLYGLPTMLIMLWFMVVVINMTPAGELGAIGYLPVLNIVDLSSFAALFLMWKMFNNQSKVFFIESSIIVKAILALTVFLLVNASMLRGFHYWFDMEYRLQTMLSSFRVQTSLSILWAISAVALMIFATKRKLRYVWMTGIGLIVVVVVKLFLVDMSASGSIERIIAFLSVGLLLSLVGYFSPIPPEIHNSTTVD